MTCIVGIIENGVTYLGGDAAGSNIRDGDIGTRIHPKVFDRNGYIFGYTTSFRMGDLLELVCQPPHKKEKFINLRMHLVKTWIPELRKTLKSEGFIEVDKNQERCGTFIVGYQGEMCLVYDDMQVGVPSDGYCSVGSGSRYALGALYALRSIDMRAEEKIKTALKAAAYHNAYVREPFTIVKT